MKVFDTKLKDVKIIEPDVFEDERGFFTESYSEEKYKKLGMDFNFVQDNHSLSFEVDAGIAFDDTELAIDWQIDLSKTFISDKDRNLPIFKEF